MKQKHLVAKVLILALALFANIMIARYKPSHLDDKLGIWMDLRADVPLTAKVYYLLSDQPQDADFIEAQSVPAAYKEVGEETRLGFGIPLNATRLRLDPAETVAKIEISDMTIQYGEDVLETVDLEAAGDTNAIELSREGNVWQLEATEGDNHIELAPLDAEATLAVADRAHARNDLIKKIILLAALDILVLIIFLRWKEVSEIPEELAEHKGLIFKLGKNDFKTKFAGSYLGIIWAFVQPVITILVYWFVFEKALHAGAQATKAGITVPYVLWLIGGIVPWFFFSDCLATATGSLIEYSYLVKKVVFNIGILPVVKIVSSLFVHLFFLGFTLVIYSCYGMFPGVYALQIFYYSICLIAFAMALGYLNSAINVFFRDLSQIISIVLQVGIWVTPIMWNIEVMSFGGIGDLIIRLNPLCYIVTGYRDALISHSWFWERPYMTLYFWVATGFIFLIGTTIFRRLRVHFADVL